MYCSHVRVHDLFIESLSRTSQFLATKCASYGEIYDEKCSNLGDTVLMGGDFLREEHGEPRPFGLYYLKTRGKPPFALFRSIP